MYPRLANMSLACLLLLSTIPQITAETNPPSLPSKSDSPIIAPASDITSIARALQRQFKGLMVAKETLIELTALRSPALEEKLIKVSHWMDEQAVLNKPITSLTQAQAQLVIYATIASYFEMILSEQGTELDPLDINTITQHGGQQLNEETIKTVLIPALNDDINKLLTTISQHLHETLTNIITQQRTQLHTVQEILQTIINKINNGKSPNKTAMREHIALLRNQVQEAIQSINQQPLSPQLIQQLHLINTIIIEQLEQASHNFDRIEPITEETMKRAGSKMVDFVATVQDINTLTPRLAKLEEVVEAADLSLLERSSRALSDYVFSPLYRHRYPILLAGATTGIAAAIWYYGNFEGGSLGHKIRYWNPFGSKEPLIGTHEDIFDAMHKSDVSTTLIEPQAALRYAALEKYSGIKPASTSTRGLLGKAEHLIGDVISGRLPILSASIGALFYTSNQTWKHYRLGDKMSSIFNYLKGGSYRKNMLKKQFALAPVTFDEVIGMQHAKDTMLQIFNYLENPERWDAADIKLPTVLLLTGKTRSGKTHFANASRGEANKRLSGKINFQFREIDHEEIREYGIKTILEMAKLYWAPCILFIDELHLLHLQDVGDTKLYNDFLTALSGFDTPDPKRPVILIAATNKPENLGKALRQKGRFGTEIRFEYPTVEERKTYIANRLKHYAIDPAGFGIDLDKLARETEGCTYEMISGVISAAFIQINLHGGTMSQAALEHAIDTEIYKIVFTEDKDVPASEKKFLSAFWAGVAFAANELDMHKKIARITTRPVITEMKEEIVGSDLWRPEEYNKQAETARGDIWTYHEKDTLGIMTQEERVTEIKVYLAGRAAEKLLMGTTSSYWSSMRQWALDSIKAIIAPGLDLNKLPPQSQYEIIVKAQEQLMQYEKEVEELLTNNKEMIEILTSLFETHQTLSGNTLKSVIDIIKKEGVEAFKQEMALAQGAQQEATVNWLDLFDQPIPEA